MITSASGLPIDYENSFAALITDELAARRSHQFCDLQSLLTADFLLQHQQVINERISQARLIRIHHFRAEPLTIPLEGPHTLQKVWYLIRNGNLLQWFTIHLKCVSLSL